MSDSSPSSDLLWAPIQLGPTTVPNRLVVAPMSRVSAGTRGVPTARMAEYYAEFARGGFGLIITEGTYTDSAYSRGYAEQPGLVSEDQLSGWRDVVAAVHADGGLLVAQLMHAGALSQHLTSTLGPSRIAPLGEKLSEYGGTGTFPMPIAATDGDLQTAIAGIVASACAAREAGFDGVEVHGANGYLIDQFLTDYTNDRDDRYGGGPSARARLAQDVVSAVRGAVGPDWLVGLRLSQTKVNDLQYRWPGVEEASEILNAVASGGPDYLHIASEGRDWRATAQLPDGPTVTTLARDLTGLPVIANGGMHDPEQARSVLATGDADLVSIARGALANPDWPRRVRSGVALREFDPQMLQPTAGLSSQDRWSNEVLRAGDG